MSTVHVEGNHCARSDVSINPDHALGFTGIGLPVENTLISLRRLHSLAFGFETFAFWQKAELSRRSTVFQDNPIPVLTKYLSLSNIDEYPLILYDNYGKSLTIVQE
jgi:hypothetical protein